MELFEDFKVMEDFAYECIPETDVFRRNLLKKLSKSHPFARFRDMAYSSPYAQKWNEFRHKRYVKYVRECIEYELNQLDTEE